MKWSKLRQKKKKQDDQNVYRYVHDVLENCYQYLTFNLFYDMQFLLVYHYFITITGSIYISVYWPDTGFQAVSTRQQTQQLWTNILATHF